MGCETFLGFPRWYEYVMQPGTCEIKENFELLGGDTWLVVAAILEILLRISVFVSFIFIIVGGYRIIVSGGSPDNVSKGQQTISKAIIGFALAVMATTIVSYLARELGATGITIDADGNVVAAVNNQGAVQFLTALAFRIATGLTVIFVALSGFYFTTAGGDPQKVSRARSSIIFALIGLLITLFAATIVAAVGGRL